MPQHPPPHKAPAPPPHEAPGPADLTKEPIGVGSLLLEGSCCYQVLAAT